MIRLGRQKARGDATGVADIRRAAAHLLEILERLARRGDTSMEEESLRKLRLQTERASDPASLEAAAADIEGLALPRTIGVDGPAGKGPDAIVADAAQGAVGVARATGIDGVETGLDRLANAPKPRPRPEACKTLEEEMEQLAYAVLFLRQRGDVMHTSMSEVSLLLASLAEHEPDAVLRLERTQQRLAAAQTIGELEMLREHLVRDAEEMVSEARQRVARSEEVGEMLRFHQAHQRVLEMALDNATTMAETDALTGLGNRRALERTVTHLAKHGYDVGVVSLDIDHFKKVNDKYGHDAGDQVLATTANVLRAELRGADRAYRAGGEEFVILLPDTGEEGSIRTADRIRQSLEEQLIALRDSGETIRITASFGVAVWGARGNYRSAVSRSDKALYQAKRRGRNQVVAA